MAKCRTKVYCNVGTLLFVYSLQTEEKYGNKERKLKYILFQMKMRIHFNYLYIFKPTTNEAISLYVRFFIYNSTMKRPGTSTLKIFYRPSQM